jgi:hypothetical protein
MIIIGAETERNQSNHYSLLNSIMSNPSSNEDEVKRQFQVNDIIDWKVLGNPLKSLPTTVLLTSSHGLGVQVSADSGALLRRDQISSLDASFAIGDALLLTGFCKPGPLTIVFENPVFVASTQLQSTTSQITEYVASIEGFDTLDNSLGKIKVPGTNIQSGGGVIDLSLFDSKGRIKKLVIAAKEQGIHMPFAINCIYLQVDMGSLAKTY